MIDLAELKKLSISEALAVREALEQRFEEARQEIKEQAEALEMKCVANGTRSKKKGRQHRNDDHD